MLILKMILALLIFLILLFFANQNSADVSLYYGAEAPLELPLFLAILGALLIGMVFALLISYYEKLKMIGQIRALRKEKKQVEGELNSLRKMPIVGSHKTELPQTNKTESSKGST